MVKACWTVCVAIAGESAAHAVHSHLGQFDHCIHTTSVVEVKLYRFVETKQEITALVAKASNAGALLVYTFAQPHLREAMALALDQMRMKPAFGFRSKRPTLQSVDLWGPGISLCREQARYHHYEMHAHPLCVSMCLPFGV